MTCGLCCPCDIEKMLFKLCKGSLINNLQTDLSISHFVDCQFGKKLKIKEEKKSKIGQEQLHSRLLILKKIMTVFQNGIF